MQKHLLIILLFFCAFAAPARAQLVFTASEWDFGTVLEANGKVTHTFTAENRGNKPVVILDVVTTCGCTAPEFSKQPILPGKQTSVKVSFDPSNRPGTFAKELYVYSTERVKLATLIIRGEVTPRQKSIEERYPVNAGSGLRLTGTLCAFSYIYQGKSVWSAIGYANTSSHALTLDLRPAVSSGVLSSDYPRRIAPGEQGEITFNYTIPATKPRYGTIRDLLDVYVDSRTSPTQLLVHGIGADAPPDDLQTAPRAEVSDQIIRLGTIKHTAPIQRRLFTITNTGRSPLIIRAVEMQGHIGCTLKSGRTIPVGGTAKVEVTLDPSKQDYGTLSDQLTLITNDPVRPMRRIRVVAVLED